MSTDELIAELAPNGVEFKALGEVGEFIRGSGLQKSDLSDHGAPAIHYGQVHTHYGIWTETTKSFTDPALAVRLRRAKPGDLIIATTSEDDAAVAKATAWIGDGEVAISGDAYIYRHSLDPRYVAYFFQSEQFQSQKVRFITGTKVRRVSGDSLARVRIPVPPLAVQREIVRVLDHLTQLEAGLEVELEAELEARRRQYEYYRDRLLSLRDGEGRRIAMGDLGSFIRGRRFTKADMVALGIPAIHYGEIYTHYGISANQSRSFVRSGLSSSLRYAQPGDVVVAGVGETVEDVAKAVAWVGDSQVAIHDDCFAFRSEADPEYIAHVMQTTDFQLQKKQLVARAKVKRIGAGSLGRIVVPVPSLDEQRRIVKILDKFDALVNDLSVGLPAELVARRKQYEYYRNKLLTFEEAPA